MPDGIEDRDADVWEALLAVADLAGGHWPDTARVAAVAAVADSMRNTESLGVSPAPRPPHRLPQSSTDRLSSASALTNLRGIEESPWDSINRDGSALNPRGLAQRLSRYGIKSGNIKGDDGKVLKGYFRSQFMDAWIRYLPDDDQEDSKPEDPEEPVAADDLSLFRMESATAATAATAQVNDGAPPSRMECATAATAASALPCVHCGEPVAAGQSNAAGQPAHLSCQQAPQPVNSARRFRMLSRLRTPRGDAGAPRPLHRRGGAG